MPVLPRGLSRLASAAVCAGGRAEKCWLDESKRQVVCRGDWLHGHALVRWYHAKAKFWELADKYRLTKPIKKGLAEAGRKERQSA